MLDNPADAVSLARIANRPRRGIGDTSLARLRVYADAQGMTLWEALAQPLEAGLGAPRHGRYPGFRSLMESFMAQAGEFDGAGPARARARPDRHARGARSRADGRGSRAGIENLQELVGVSREFHETAEDSGLSTFLQGVSLTRTRTTCKRSAVWSA